MVHDEIVMIGIHVNFRIMLLQVTRSTDYGCPEEFAPTQF